MKKLSWFPLVGLIFYEIDNKDQSLYWDRNYPSYAVYQCIMFFGIFIGSAIFLSK